MAEMEVEVAQAKSVRGSNRNWKLEKRREQIEAFLSEAPSATFDEVVAASRIEVSANRAEVCRKQSARILAELLEAGLVDADFRTARSNG